MMRSGPGGAGSGMLQISFAADLAAGRSPGVDFNY